MHSTWEPSPLLQIARGRSRTLFAREVAEGVAAMVVSMGAFGARKVLRATLTPGVRCLSDFTHIVIGGGIVGTAIGAELQQEPLANVLLLDKNSQLGMETTSRNSEVIHAGIYYPKDSLKAQLCIQGKNKIYDAFESGSFSSVQVPFKRCGKYVVAQTEEEHSYIEQLHRKCEDLQVPLRIVSANEVQSTCPLIEAKHGALESPTTGIISVHDYMLFFQSQFENAGGTLGLNSEVVGVSYNGSYTVQIRESNSEDLFELTADNIVNSAGLYAPRVSNMILPEDRHLQTYLAKGSYFSYQPGNHISTSKIAQKLIYPCPNPNATSLGTHLTFDLGGQLRFGPDLEWLDCDDASLIEYDVSSKNLQPAFEAIRRYFPHIQKDELQPAYSGVRPKNASQKDSQGTFSDFIIREEAGYPGFVNLLGIESPGVTASWAIAELVRDMYR